MADMSAVGEEKLSPNHDDLQQAGNGADNRGTKRGRMSAEDDDDDDDKPGRERRKIEIKFIQDKSRRHITFSKRKAGIMKKVCRDPIQLSPLTPSTSTLGDFHPFQSPPLYSYNNAIEMNMNDVAGGHKITQGKIKLPSYQHKLTVCCNRPMSSQFLLAPRCFSWSSPRLALHLNPPRTSEYNITNERTC